MANKRLFDDRFNSLVNVGDMIFIEEKYKSNQVVCAVFNYNKSSLRNPTGKKLESKKMPNNEYRVMLVGYNTQ